MNNTIFLIGRILLASVFLSAAVFKLSNIPGTQKLMVAHGMSWTGFWRQLGLHLHRPTDNHGGLSSSRTKPPSGS